MSYFESVRLKLVCERCGQVHETVVRFRSFVGRPDGEYELLEVASPADGLVKGEVWEGNGDRYCERCMRKWAEAQAYAAYDSLKELIEKGLVTARAKGSRTPLAPEDVTDYVEQYASECREDGVFPVTMPYFEELRLTVGDKPHHPNKLFTTEGAAIWSEFLDLIGPLLSERMKNDGWNDYTWEDFRVSLDDERRVVVEDLQGKRLTRDGRRIG